MTTKSPEELRENFDHFDGNERFDFQELAGWFADR